MSSSMGKCSRARPGTQIGSTGLYPHSGVASYQLDIASSMRLAVQGVFLKPSRLVVLGSWGALQRSGPMTLQ